MTGPSVRPGVRTTRTISSGALAAALWASAVLLFLIVHGVTAAPSYGQGRRAAFDSLDIGVRGYVNVNRNDLHRFWDPGPALELAGATPFYLGVVELGLQYSSFDAKSDEQPDFHSLYPFVGWGLKRSLPLGLAGHAGARIGTLVLRFEGLEESLTEQELGLALRSSLSRPLGSGWSVELSGSYQVVFTNKRMRLFHLGAGLRRSIATPGWLRGILD